MLTPAQVRRCCAELGGLVRTSEFAARGILASALRRAVGAGEAIRLREGMYGVPDLPPAVQTAVRHGGSLGCLSRVRHAGLWVLVEPAVVHVSMPRTGRRRAHDDCECVTHWGDTDPTRPLIGLGDALIQMLHCRGREEFFVALESAMRRRFLSRSSLARVRARIPESHRWLVDFARWDADSGLESLLRLRLARVGIVLRPQVVLPGVGRVDFLLGDAIVLEVDGVPGHADSAMSRHKDLVRDAVASLYGLEALRFDYALVVHDWPLVEAAILAAVARARPRR